MSTTRHVLLTALLLGACTDGVARESVPAEAEPEPTAAVVTIDGRDQYALLVSDSWSNARLKVVMSIGLPSWTPGRTFAARALKGARPLAA